MSTARIADGHSTTTIPIPLNLHEVQARASEMIGLLGVTDSVIGWNVEFYARHKRDECLPYPRASIQLPWEDFRRLFIHGSMVPFEMKLSGGWHEYRVIDGCIDWIGLEPL